MIIFDQVYHAPDWFDLTDRQRSELAYFNITVKDHLRFRKFYSVCFDATARSQKSKEYSYRIKAESEFKHALDNDWYPLFITLTFSQPMLRIADTDGFNGPGIFLSRFSKDVARTVYGTDRPVGVSKSEYIRYLSVPEFGDLNDRAHYHMLVFVKDLPDYARRCPTAIGS